MRRALKLVAAVSVACTSLIAASQESGQTKRALPAMNSAPTSQAGSMFMPESSKEQGAGKVHTTYVLRSADGAKPAGLHAPMAMSTVGPLATTQEAETPQSLGCLYVKSPTSAGCIPNYSAG